MFLSSGLGDQSPDYLQEAIQRLKRGLPNLLGPNHLSFLAGLDSLLCGGKGEACALAQRYPQVSDRLRNRLSYFSAGHGLYGNSVSDLPPRRYRCPEGHYINVGPNDRLRKDVMGRLLCPFHDKPMKLA